MKLNPVSFISESIEVEFDKEPLYEKKPPCPDGFFWQGNHFRIVELISEWKDFNRRGRFAHNMRLVNIKKTLRRGSIGVGRFYFQVRTDGGRFFLLYYDRSVKSADDRKGVWTLSQELEQSV